MTTFTERDIQRNMRSVAHAIAQQEVEGLKVTASTVITLIFTGLHVARSTRMKSSATFTVASRMSRYSDSDPYLDPASGVLKNRLDIARRGHP